MIHVDPHSLAGQSVPVTLKGTPPGAEPQVMVVEDYWDRITGGSWMYAEGNLAALKYAVRSGIAGLPTDNEVVYGKIGPFGHIVHTSELGDIVEDEQVKA